MGDAASSHEGRYRAGDVIVLAPPDASWAATYAREASSISNALSDFTFDVHHIGSTAIPDIVAKPVIDMLGVVPTVVALDARAHRLAALGYEALGEFGIPGRRYFRKNAPDGARTHQLHAFAVGSPEIQRHLDFRDYLRAFPQEAAAYAALKQILAGSCGSDMQAYSDGKTEFIRAVDRRAAAWRVSAARPPGTQYLLTGRDGLQHWSATPGLLGGNRRSKIYGRLDCASAVRALLRGSGESRVFFADATAARAAGYRPCGSCLRTEYALWKASSADRAG